MAFSRPTKLVLLAGTSCALAAILIASIQESQTIIVSTNSKPPEHSPTVVSASVTSDLIAPRYTGRSANGAWEVTASRASQLSTAQGIGTVAGEVSLSQIQATWKAPASSPISLSAPHASLTPSTSEIVFPAGLKASGDVAGYQTFLHARQGAANLSATTLTLAGGVSATLVPR